MGNNNYVILLQMWCDLMAAHNILYLGHSSKFFLTHTLFKTHIIILYITTTMYYWKKYSFKKKRFFCHEVCSFCSLCSPHLTYECFVSIAQFVVTITFTTNERSTLSLLFVKIKVENIMIIVHSKLKRYHVQKKLLLIFHITSCHINNSK